MRCADRGVFFGAGDEGDANERGDLISTTIDLVPACRRIVKLPYLNILVLRD
jgi:hypothetical protein